MSDMKRENELSRWPCKQTEEVAENENPGEMYHP